MPVLAANITLMFREAPLRERIAAAARAGFRAVECLWPYEIPAADFRAELDRHEMTFALLNTPLGSGDQSHAGLAACAGREDDFARLLTKALDYARVAGARRIHVMVGEWPVTPANRAALVANLRAGARRAHDNGMTLCIEPINGRDRPGWFLKDTAMALDVLTDVASPAVKLQFDVYHVQIIEGDLIRRLESCIGQVGHVQIAGVPDRNEPDGGEVNIHAVLAAIDRLGYTGIVGCEYDPRGATTDGLGWAARYGITGTSGEQA